MELPPSARSNSKVEEGGETTVREQVWPLPSLAGP